MIFTVIYEFSINIEIRGLAQSRNPKLVPHDIYWFHSLKFIDMHYLSNFLYTGISA